MAKRPSRTQQGRVHEEFIAEILGGRRSRSSGAQFNDQMDGRHDEGRWKFAWDGKSTFSGSIGVSRAMWAKAVEQSHDAHPLLPLRFYTDYKLSPALDLVVCDLHDFAEMVAELRGEL